MKHNLPLSLKLIRGAIGKEFVIKHYRYGVIKTKFPDMARIIASERQRKLRNLFKEAVAYAKEVIADGEQKRAWQKRLRKRNSVYNAAVKFYMLKDKRAKEAAMLEAGRLLRLALKNEEKRCAGEQQPAQAFQCLLSDQANVLISGPEIHNGYG